MAGESGIMRAAKVVDEKLATNRVAEFSLWGWWQKERWRRIAFYVVLGIVVVVALLVVSLAMAGELGNFYDWLTGWTNKGEAWTKYMRDHPAVFPPLALALFLGLGYVLVPKGLWGPAFLSSFIVFFLGFLAGHVYW